MEKLDNNRIPHKQEREKNVSFFLESEKHFTEWKAKIDFVALSHYLDTTSFTIEDFLESRRFQEFILLELGLESLEDNDEAIKKAKEELLTLYKEKGVLGFSTYLFEELRKRYKRERKSENPVFGKIEYENGYIHFNEQEKEVTLQESFAQLCDFLIQQKILPKEIRAESWLMDVDALRERIHFHKDEKVVLLSKQTELAEKNKNPDELIFGPALWGQILDSRGNYKEKELHYLIENKTLRYGIRDAYIPIKELFDHYGKKYKGREITVRRHTRKEIEDFFQREKMNLVELFNTGDVETFQRKKEKTILWKILSQTNEGRELFSFIEKHIGKENDFSKIRKMYIDTYGADKLKELVSSVLEKEIERYKKELYSETEKIIL